MIRCDELTKYFNGTRALKNCSFEITEPTLTGVIGVNGAGKTTLFKSLAGFLKPTSGMPSLFGEEAFQNITVAQNVMLIEEGMQFYPGVSLYELLDSYQQFYEDFDITLAKGLLNYFNLPGEARYERLSKGMASTFRLILALSARAAVTLLDEPTTGMDPSVRKDVYELILKDYIKAPRIILISSHYLGEMESILDHILLIDEGRVLEHGALEEFQSLFVAVKGSPEIITSLEEKLQVFEGKDFGPGIRQIVVKREEFLNLHLWDEVKESLTVNSISPEDSFIYLTRRKGGGIHELYDS